MANMDLSRWRIAYGEAPKTGDEGFWIYQNKRTNQQKDFEGSYQDLLAQMPDGDWTLLP